MQLSVSSVKGYLEIDAVAAKTAREEFIAHARRAAEVADIEPPSRDVFKRDKANPTFSVWYGHTWNVKQGLAASCIEWLDPLLGYERFLVHMGPRPDGHGCERLDDTQPWGPGNAAWTPKVKSW